MKKIALIAVALTVISTSIVSADFMEIRGGWGKTNEIYWLIEKNFGKISVGSNGVFSDDFWNINPNVFFQLLENLEIGVKYDGNSLKSQSLGPAVRWKKISPELGLGGIIDITHYF